MSCEDNGESGDVCVTIAPRARVRRRRCIIGHVPQHFEEFYRANLRFVVGARMKRLQVAQLYASWAAENERPSMNLRQVKRAIVNIGHGAIESNGMYYLDLGLAKSFPDVPDNYPTPRLPAEARVAHISDRLDALITELSALRADVVAKIENKITELSSIRAHVTKTCPAQPQTEGRRR